MGEYRPTKTEQDRRRSLEDTLDFEREPVPMGPSWRMLRESVIPIGAGSDGGVE